MHLPKKTGKIIRCFLVVPFMIMLGLTAGNVFSEEQAEGNQQEVIGDLNHQRFEEVWNSETIRKYRAYHMAGEFDKIPICADCNVWASRPRFCFSDQSA